MTADTLIIRSTSTQNLEKQMPSISEHLANGTVDVLTHKEGYGSIQEKFPDAGIVLYPFEEDFSPSRVLFGTLADQKIRKYKTVVVPMSNRSGDGYLNVLLFSLFLNPDRIVSCDKQGTLRTVSKRHILLRSVKEGTLVVPTLALTLLMVACGILCLTVSWVFHKIFKRVSPVKIS